MFEVENLYISWEKSTLKIHDIKSKEILKHHTNFCQRTLLILESWKSSYGQWRVKFQVGEVFTVFQCGIKPKKKKS